MIRRMPIRILHVIDSLGNGGLENGVVNLIRHMDPGRFEHCVCTVRASGVNLERLPAERVRVVQMAKDERSRFQARQLTRIIRECSPHIVHSRNWGAIEGVVAARFACAGAIVHSEHGMETDALTAPPWRRTCFRRLAFEMADRVFCVSDALREVHARRTGFPARRIGVIHNGVDTQRFRPDPAARVRMRRELNIGETDFCIGCLGSLRAVKDHMTLLRAVERLGSAASAWRLVIAGEGPERRKLEEAAARASRSGARISLPGTSGRAPELLNAFDVYVLPSLNEGVSNSLLEAMATGLPVIASCAGGTPEVVEDGISGLQFRAGEPEKLAELLFRLSAGEHSRERFGEAARRRVQAKFSLDSMLRNYELMYETLMPAGHALTAGAAP